MCRFQYLIMGLAQSHLLELVPYVKDFVIKQKCHYSLLVYTSMLLID